MKSLILCEGKYDLRLLGYYIHKISHERFCRCNGRKKSKLLKKVKVPVLRGSGNQVEIYCADDNADDIAAIYVSDGKSNLLKDIRDLCHNSIYYPETKFDTIVILSDRDESDIESIKQNPNITSYLNHTGQIHKAKYSAVISVLNPDHGSGTYDDLLMSIDWENHDVFNEHFSALKELFS